MKCPICGAAGCKCKGNSPEPRHIITLERKPMNSNMWTSDRRLYLDEEGNVVEHDNPAKVELLVGVGGSIPMARARELGLVDTPKAKSEPPATKAVTKAPANKGKKEG